MAMIISPESELGKEMAKWEKPYVYEPFPKMMYQARRRPDGVVSVGESDDAVFGAKAGAAEQFTATTQRIVNSDAEQSLEHERGWRNTPQDAKAFFEAREKGISTEAAHRAHDDRNMGDLAKKEAAAAEAETVEHVAEVPRKKARRKPGRPRKNG